MSKQFSSTILISCHQYPASKKCVCECLPSKLLEKSRFSIAFLISGGRVLVSGPFHWQCSRTRLWLMEGGTVNASERQLTWDSNVCTGCNFLVAGMEFQAVYTCRAVETKSDMLVPMFFAMFLHITSLLKKRLNDKPKVNAVTVDGHWRLVQQFYRWWLNCFHVGTMFCGSNLLYESI